MPEAWNSRVSEYLGLEVPEGQARLPAGRAWSFGGFGYFPTYQLGNVISVQIWERLRADLGDTDAMVEQGDFTAIGDWLRDTLYVLGSRFTPSETVERVAGGPIDPEPYLRYLTEKFGVGAGSLSSPKARRSRRALRHAYRCRRARARRPASTRCSRRG